AVPQAVSSSAIRGIADPSLYLVVFKFSAIHV
ncbi:MAG: hypothetical protein ACI9QN_001807, partial [Arcticibacterium sp.]